MNHLVKLVYACLISFFAAKKMMYIAYCAVFCFSASMQVKATTQEVLRNYFPNKISHIIMRDGDSNVFIQDKIIVFEVARFLHLLSPIKERTHQNKNKILQIKLHHEDMGDITYDIMQDDHDKFYAVKSESYFNLSKDDFLILLHAKNGYRANLPTKVEIEFKDAKERVAYMVSQRDAIYIKKEEINGKYYYSGHLLTNYLMRDVIYFVRVTDFHETLSALLQKDKTISRLKHAVTWVHPSYMHHKNLKRAIKLSEAEKKEIVKYVIDEKLNLNWSYYQLKSFYSSKQKGEQ